MHTLAGQLAQAAADLQVVLVQHIAAAADKDQAFRHQDPCISSHSIRLNILPSYTRAETTLGFRSEVQPCMQTDMSTQRGTCAIASSGRSATTYRQPHTGTLPRVHYGQGCTHTRTHARTHLQSCLPSTPGGMQTVVKLGRRCSRGTCICRPIFSRPSHSISAAAQRGRLHHREACGSGKM